MTGVWLYLVVSSFFAGVAMEQSVEDKARASRREHAAIGLISAVIWPYFLATEVLPETLRATFDAAFKR